MGYYSPSICQRLEVLVEKPMVIRPARPTDKSTIFLHNIDQQVFFHVEMLFIYDVGSPDDTGDVVDRIQNALGEALVPYYFAAGRLKVNEEDSRLELDCNEQGAVFAGAYCDSTVSELGDIRVPNPEFRKLFVYPANVKKISDLPLVTIQVTRFKCGGFIVGIYASHVIFDGIAGCQFYNDLAKISRGESLSAYPTPDRTCLQARCPPRISYDHRELTQLPDVPAKLLFNPSIYNPEAPPKHAFRIFSFTSEDLNALKKKALEDGSIARCSTFEALTAHIWQAKTKAAGMDPDSISKLFMVVNIRDKLKLPANFSGNAVVAAPCVETTAAAVCENPLSFCVRKVQEAVALVSEEYIRSQIDWCEANGHGIVNVPGGMIITPWSKLAFNEVDFGWGRPTYITPVVNERPEYVIVLSNCRGDGGVDMFVGIEFERATKLEECLSI